MYKIFADSELIYDSTSEDYKIGKGVVTLETNKSGSFVFSVYPDHFYYDRFVKLKTVITVHKDGKIVFRGRVLNDVSDYWNNKVLTCEGELGFLQDSTIRPFSFTGTPEDLFEKFITEHNAQVGEFKRFKVGSVTVADPNGISRDNASYESALTNLSAQLLDGGLGGYLFITHGENGTDPIPTLNYLADFTKIATQKIEFGSNLKDYTKTVDAKDIITAIIPLGAEIDDGNSDTPNPRVTIASVNGGKDYIYDASGVALRDWIIRPVTWDNITDPAILKAEAEKYLKTIVEQNITIELSAIDLHLLDPDIESFNLGDYIQVTSDPHNFDSTLLCNKQTLDLLNPGNDSLILGHNYSSFTETSSRVTSTVSGIPEIKSSVTKVGNKVVELGDTTLKPVTLFEASESTSSTGYTTAQTGNCDISAYARIKVFYKDSGGNLFGTEFHTGKKTEASTHLVAIAGTRYVNSALSFKNNAFTLELSTKHDITGSIAYSNKDSRYLSIYRIEGYKI